MSLPNTIIEVPDLHRVSDIVYGSDGTLFAVLYMDGSVRLYEMDDKKTFTEIAHSDSCCKYATSLSFANHEYGAIYVFGDETGRVFLYQRVKQNEVKLVTTFNNHKSPINCVAFAPLGLCFASASSDGTVSITTCTNQQWTSQPIRVSDRPVTSVSWSPPSFLSFIEKPNTGETSKLVASAADGQITMYSNTGGPWAMDCPPVQAHSGPVNCAAWRPLAGFQRIEIATCGEDGYVKLWYYENHEWGYYEICQAKYPPVSVKWSPCGFILYIGMGQSVTALYREIGKGLWKRLDTDKM